MARSYSNTFKEKSNSTGADEAPLYLLEIDHADLSSPVRVVNDNQDLVSNGNTFVAMAFRVTLPDDLQHGLPHAKLSVDNIGRELTQWLESSGGGKGATVRIMQVLRSDPDTLEFDITMDLSNVSMSMSQITGTLGFEDLLNRPAVPLTYRPDTTPGLF